MNRIRRAAYSIALTPFHGRDECAGQPRTVQRQTLKPLWAVTGAMLVGSPTMQPSGSSPRARISAIMPGAPRHPTSSS